MQAVHSVRHPQKSEHDEQREDQLIPERLRPKLRSTLPGPAKRLTCCLVRARARVPRHELEAEAIVDHGEAAGGK